MKYECCINDQVGPYHLRNILINHRSTYRYYSNHSGISATGHFKIRDSTATLGLTRNQVQPDVCWLQQSSNLHIQDSVRTADERIEMERPGKRVNSGECIHADRPYEFM